jgi:hypothetical protein
MEVILKKTKISNSILKQCLRATDTDFVNGIVLGWCIYQQLKYIVCYRQDTKSLSKYPMFKEIEFGENFKQEERYKNILDGYWVNVKLGGNYTPVTYSTKDEVEKDFFIACLTKAKNDAESKGQFFI